MPKRSWREFEHFDPQENTKKLQIDQSQSPRLVRIERVRGGRGGKIVTIIRGLCLNDSTLRKLLKQLKIECGTGGTVKADVIELQGDQVSVAIELLKKEGFNAKQSGG